MAGSKKTQVRVHELWSDWKQEYMSVRVHEAVTGFLGWKRENMNISVHESGNGFFYFFILGWKQENMNVRVHKSVNGFKKIKIIIVFCLF